jgi:uncharacterized membrane protein
LWGLVPLDRVGLFALEEEFYRRLKEEVEEWRRDGIISGDQAEVILRRYGVEERGFRPGKVITALSILGTVLVGVGVILFFASNWKRIPDFYKVALLFIITFGTYTIGYIMRFEKKTYPRVGHALLLLASIFVGATIFLVGQIFHINVDAHWLVLLWFIAISPMGYVFDSRPTLGLNILIFTLWMGIFVSGYRLFYLESIPLLYMLFGIALYSLGQLHELIDRWHRFRMVYKGFGIFFVLATYFYFSSSIRSSYSHFFVVEHIKFVTPHFLLGAFVLIALASVVTNLIWRERIKSTRYEFYVLVAAFVGWIFLFIINTYPQLLYEEVERYGRTSYQLGTDIRAVISIVLNLFLFGLSIGTISIGYYKNQAPFINIGVLFFALAVIKVYVDYFYGMLPRSIALVVGGIVLLAIATYLEKKRRVLLSSIRRPQP